MELISIAAATPGYVENFRYQDGGMEKNIQDELDARLDHIYVARVVNWPIANESDFGVSGWTPTDSLLLYISSDNLFVTKGLAYMGGRHLEAGGELFSTDDPATDTYYVYLKYTFSSDTFEYEYATSEPTDTNLVKHLMLGTADWSTSTKFWSAAVDLRSSNTSLGAPATVSGSDAGAIFTVENTGAGDGLLVKNSDAVIGESSTPQQLIIQGDGTKALSIYNSASSVEMVCSAADTLKVQTVANGDAELIVKTLNGMVMASGIVTTGTWQATIIAKAYLAVHDHTAIGEGGDYAWAYITALSDTNPLATGTTTAGTSTEVSRYDHRHDIGTHNHDSDYYTETEQESWPKRAHYLDKYTSGSITETTYLAYPVLKIPALSSDWAYYFFRIPHTWNSSTSSELIFVVNAEASFTDGCDWYIEVKGYRPSGGEGPLAAWNITTGTPGQAIAGTGFSTLGTTSGGINFDAGVDGGDLVVARFRWDGIENDQISYIYDAYIEYQ